MWPSIIPKRRAVVFSISTSGVLATGELAVLELDTGTVRRLGVPGSSPRYVSTGHLVFAASDGSVQAVPFDDKSLEVTGPPVRVVEGVAMHYSGAAHFTVSEAGHLAYIPGPPESALRSLVWVERDGREEALDGQPRAFEVVRFSLDGTRLALEINSPQPDIWTLTLASGVYQRVTDDPAAEGNPVWMKGGERVVFSSSGYHIAASNGTGTARPLEIQDGLFEGVPTDGTVFIDRRGTRGIGMGYDVMVVSVEDGIRAPLIASPFNELNGVLHPDGNWIAYQSDQSGQYEIHVRPFPDVDSDQFVVSTDGGTHPTWAPGGDELFYVEGDRMMAVPVHVGPTFDQSPPEPLFSMDGYYLQPSSHSYDVAPDGSSS